MDVTENHVDILGDSCFSQLAVFLRRIDSGFLPLDRTIARRWKLRWWMAVERLVGREGKLLLVLRIEWAAVTAGDLGARPEQGANRAGTRRCARVKP